MPRRHSTLRFLHAPIVAIAAAVGMELPVRATEPAAAVDGVLVLRNGNVMSGAVRRFGEDYRIAVGGAELQVPAKQVEMFAATLDDAYEARRRERAGMSADSHLELARWCLRLGLLNQAARELLDARTLDPRHSAIAPLETQVREMMELEAVWRERSAAPAVVSAVDEGAEAPPAEPPPPISIAAQAQFVRSIQPMLVNGCATSGCHQPGSAQQLQLDRWALEGNGSPEIVRRNLASVLSQLTLDDPPSSPLVTWARTAHGQRGSAASRPIAPHQAALLLEWLNLAAGVEPTLEGPPDVAIFGADGGALELVPETGPPLAELEAVGAESAGARFTPRDAFDPEIFNRRHAPKASPAESTEVDDDAALPAMDAPDAPPLTTE